MLGLYCCLLIVSAQPAQSADVEQTAQEDPELIEVSGRALKAIGSAMAGSSGTVGYEDLKNRPIARVGEILEVVPGLIATQHSGTGKANQLFLRGFNLDHGTDFATSVDGIPLNMRSHGHGQGYTDLNIVIPELVERVDFKKGPYHLNVGDFSSAGSADISSYNRLDNNFARATFGEFGYGRVVLANSFDLSRNTHLLTAIEGQRYDGPFEIEEDLEKVNGLIKLSGQNVGVDWLISLSGYHANWRATDQIPQRLIEDGSLDAFGSIDPDLGGNTTRYSASAQLTTENGHIEAYFVDYDFQLFSNFTYFLNNSFFFKTRSSRLEEDQVVEHPYHTTASVGDEIEQIDRRQLYGAEASYSFDIGGPLAMDLEVGANFRQDDIDEAGLHGTQTRVRHTLIRSDTISSTGYGGYAKASGEIGRLRFETGVRMDSLQVDVLATLSLNSGSAKDTIFSPSASLAYQISDQIEIYANYGEAFHSNDARGTTITIDPVSRNLVDSVPLLVKSRGTEIGLRFETSSLKTALVGFWLDLDSELVYVGDEGTVEAQGASRRYGFEASLYWQATDWANLFANYSYTKARFRDVDEGYIPNAVPSVLSAGLEVEPLDNLKTSLILRRVGSAPLTEDNSVRSSTTTTLNWGSYFSVERFRFGLEVLNVLDSKDADISYYFESQLLGEFFPIADVHTHQMEPRQLRVSLEVSF